MSRCVYTYICVFVWSVLVVWFAGYTVVFALQRTFLVIMRRRRQDDQRCLKHLICCCSCCCYGSALTHQGHVWARRFDVSELLCKYWEWTFLIITIRQRHYTDTPQIRNKSLKCHTIHGNRLNPRIVSGMFICTRRVTEYLLLLAVVVVSVCDRCWGS